MTDLLACGMFFMFILKVGCWEGGGATDGSMYVGAEGRERRVGIGRCGGRCMLRMMGGEIS